MPYVPRRQLSSLFAIGLGLLAMFGAMPLSGRPLPLPLMSLAVAAAAWLGGARMGYAACAVIVLATPVSDHSLSTNAGIEDFAIFALLSLGLIPVCAAAHAARVARNGAQGTLRERRMSMRVTIDGIPALIAYIDRNMRYVMHNRMYEEWYPERTIDGAEVREIIGEESFAAVRPLLIRALSGEAVSDVLVFGSDDAQHQFEVHYRPHRGESDEVIGVAMLVHDITARQVSLDSVKASEARFRSLAMTSATIVWIADSDGALIEAQGWREFTGQSPDEYLGEGWLAASHPEDRPRLESEWRRAREEGESLAGTYRLRTGDGRYRVVVGQGIPIRDGNDRVMEWIGSFRDIDDAYRLERDLLERERERDALLENVPHMVWIANASGEIVFSNRRWYEYTGLGPEDHWKSVTHPDDIAQAESFWRHSLASGDPLIVEKRFRRASDGEYRWHLIQGVPIRDADGRIDRWYGSSIDIEDQKRAIATLAEANERISRFLSILSHELRNPISGIVTASELLAREHGDRPPQGRALDMLSRHSWQLQRTIDDLLDISRVTEGRIELRIECCDLRAVVRDLVVDLEPDAMRSRVELQIVETIDGDRPRVNADEIRLRQIFTNLITNAIKASQPGHRVRIEIESPSPPGKCTVAIVDEGSGLSSEIRDTLFEPFVQSESWRRSGRGLGLAIARQLTGLHGGVLRAEEPVSGSGARFVLELPLATTRPDRDGDTEGDRRARERTDLRVLIVEDELDNAEALQSLLEARGHDVHVATDAEIAISDWRTLRHDVVLCDLELPGVLDGHDVARALRMQTPRPYLIAYSGYGQPQDLIRSREAGFDEHIVKPATFAQILEALQRAP